MISITLAIHAVIRRLFQLSNKSSSLRYPLNSDIVCRIKNVPFNIESILFWNLLKKLLRVRSIFNGKKSKSKLFKNKIIITLTRLGMQKLVSHSRQAFN